MYLCVCSVDIHVLVCTCVFVGRGKGHEYHVKGGLCHDRMDTYTYERSSVRGTVVRETYKGGRHRDRGSCLGQDNKELVMHN